MRTRVAPLTAAIAASLLLTACSGVVVPGGTTAAPTASGSASASPTASATATTTVTATTTASPTGSPGSTASPTASGAVSPTAATLELSAQGVGGYGFGSDVAIVQPVLQQRLGQPQVTENTGCQMDPRWTRSLSWQGLTVTFEADAAERTDDLAMTQWRVRPRDGVPAGVTLADGTSFDATFADLKAAHPDVELTQQLGWYVFELPEGVTWLGEDDVRPFEAWGGTVRWCE